MKAFEFKGDWVFELELSQLSDYFSFNWIGEANQRREKISIQIIDVKDENPRPEAPQINAVNFILKHQDLMIQSIYQQLKTNIIPAFKIALGEDEAIFLNLDAPKKLDQFLGIGNIYIFNKWKEDHAYVLFFFNAFRCNLERGLNMIFHKERFIGTHEDFKEAYEDLGLKYEEVLQEMSRRQQLNMENKTFEFYKAKSVTEPLKPWQITENKFYLSRLLHSKQAAKFIAFIEQHSENLEYNWSSLYNLAKNYELHDVVHYLENRNRTS